MCIDVLPTCMSTYHMHASAHRGQNRMLDLWKLELQVVVKHHLSGELYQGPLKSSQFS